MCTVIIEVPEHPDSPTRLLAIRDENPQRPWDPLGYWWPEEHPGVTGVRDRRAGGAWLAAAPARGRLAVLLNRGEQIALDASAAAQLASRGGLTLASMAGLPVLSHPNTASFNLIEVSGSASTLTRWDGHTVTRTALTPGVHMIAHDELDDSTTPRIKRWLPEFQALRAAPDSRWRSQWAEVLSRSAEMDPDDDQAIIRDNSVHGYATKSLLACLAEIGPSSVDLEDALLPEPARWGSAAFQPALQRC